MHMTKNGLVTAGVMAAMITASSVALGGSVDNTPVYVLPSVYASGALSGARYSTDDSQEIGCAAYATSSGPGAFCWAEDATGHYLSCATTDPNISATARGVNAASYVYFSVSTYGECTSVYVYNFSEYMH
jgi:hypothetical protein